MDDLQTLLTNMLGAEDSDDDEYVVRDEDESWSEYEVEDVEGEDESWSEYEVEDVEGEGEDEEDELNGEMLLIQEHLEALFQRLQEEAEAEYLQEFARVPAEKPQFDRVRCPKYHKLVYSRRKATGWACNGRDQFRDPRATKSRYGLTEDEEWKCLSGCTGYNQMDRVPVYHCSKCDFDLCFRCHERAKRGLERMKAVSATLNSTERVAWMQSKLMVVGEGRAGKTSTVRTLLGEPFVADLESTVGASLTYAKSNMNDSWNTVKEEGQAGHAITAAVKEFRQTNQDEAKVEKKLAPVEGEERRQHASGVSIESGFKAMRKKVRRALRGSSITAPLPRKFSSDKKEKKEKQPAAVMDIAEVAGKFKLDVFSDSLEEMEVNRSSHKLCFALINVEYRSGLSLRFGTVSFLSWLSSLLYSGERDNAVVRRWRTGRVLLATSSILDKIWHISGRIQRDKRADRSANGDGFPSFLDTLYPFARKGGTNCLGWHPCGRTRT